jgi:2-polyprenyl-3-methyl-5-hydroxy-6-metoxy-1,4-benzoquinol methylase
MLPFLTRYGRARGIEADPGLVHHARERGLEVDRMEFPNEIPPGRYDVVTLFDVLEHLLDDRSALDGVRKLLRPGGRVIISVPALPWLWSSHDVAVGHHRRYTPSLLGRRLREAGFRILHVTHFNTVLLPLAVLRRLFVLRSGHDLERPPRPANELMAVLLGAESSFAAGAGFRIGVSLGAVAVMPEA